MVGSIIIECLGRQNMTFEGSINHGWIYALMGVSKTEASLCNGLPGNYYKWSGQNHPLSPPQISTYYYITPVRHPYEAIKWSFNLLMGHYLLVEPRIGLSLKTAHMNRQSAIIYDSLTQRQWGHIYGSIDESGLSRHVNLLS